MPRIIKTGHGVTSEKHVRFNLLTEGEAFLRVQRTTKDEIDNLEKANCATSVYPKSLASIVVMATAGCDSKGERRTTKWRALDRILEILFSKHETAHLAARIIREIPAVRSALASPDKHVAEAARIAFRLGQWHERARVSAVWGRDAVLGASTKSARRGLAEVNKERHREAEARKERVRRDYERLRTQTKPDGSLPKKGEIVEQLAVTFDVAERTIRRDLQKK